MISKNTSFFLKKVPLSLLSLSIIMTSGCFFKKKVIPEYFPEVSTKQEKQRENKKSKNSSSLAEAISEIKSTTKEDALSQSKKREQTQKKDSLNEENPVKNSSSPMVTTQEKSSTQPEIASKNGKN